MSQEDESFVISIDTMDDLGLDFISDMPWAESFLELIQAHVQKAFLNWCKVVKSVAGTKEDNIKIWQDSYIKHIDEILCDMVDDMYRVSNETCEKISNLLERLAAVCKEVHKPFPRKIGQNKRCLLDEQADLLERIGECEKIIEVKKAEVEVLQKKQQKFCEELGEIPVYNLNCPPLPTPEQLDAFQKHIDKMEIIKFEREEQYFQLKHEILEIVKEIGYKPRTDFERMVVTSERFQVTTDNMENLVQFAEHLKKIKKLTLEEIHQLRSRIEELWKLLEIDLKDQDEFRTNYTGNSMDTLEALRTEANRCEQIKKTNIKNFVGKLRSKLSTLWDKCHCSEKDKRSFLYFDDDCYTEDLLDLHELEIQKWERYYEKNKQLLMALKEHEELWEQYMLLEESSDSTNRYKNRGGKLLKEEKLRNRLNKLIPKRQEEIKEMAYKYFEENGEHFTYTSTLAVVPKLDSGLTVEEYIASFYDDRENRRKQKLSARKQQCDKTELTSMLKTPSSLFPSSSRIATPAMPSTSKRKILGSALTESVKRLKGETPISAAKFANTPRLIPKIKITKATLPVAKQKRRSRTSGEKSSRRHSGRLVAAANRKPKRGAEQGRDTTYSLFENELSNNDACSNSTFTKNLLKTPSRTPRKTPQRTPIRTPGNLRTPSSKSPMGNHTKLTACRSNLKLLF